MINISLKDNSFSHAYSYGNGDLNILSKYIKWDRINIHDIIFYTDSFFNSDDPYKYSYKTNIAWIHEPKSIRNHLYDINSIDWSKFDYVLSHNINFIDQLNNTGKVKALWCAAGGCWIYEEDRKIYNKSKNLSIIASVKRMTHGHKLRHKIIELYKEEFCEIAGNGYNSIAYKLSALKDYRFSVIIENDNSDGNFTEKLIDCLITGTIPIYYGTKNIGTYFDLNGFILINSPEEFGNIISLLNEDYYNSKINSIKNNFELAHQYVNTEDSIYNLYKDVIFNV